MYLALLLLFFIRQKYTEKVQIVRNYLDCMMLKIRVIHVERSSCHWDGTLTKFVSLSFFSKYLIRLEITKLNFFYEYTIPRIALLLRTSHPTTTALLYICKYVVQIRLWYEKKPTLLACVHSLQHHLLSLFAFERGELGERRDATRRDISYQQSAY